MGRNKIVISGYYGFRNAGDEAMLYSILRTLDESFDRSDVTVISGNPSLTASTFDVKAVPRFGGLSIFNAIRQSYLLISGGGSLLQDVTSWKSLMYYLSIIFTGVCFGDKVFLYAQGIGPVRHRWVRWVLRFVLNHVDAITVRDSESKGFLERLGVKNKIYCTADAVLSLSPVPGDKGKEILKACGVPTDKKIIGISIRRWNEFADWGRVLNRYIDEITEKENCSVVFLPMQYPEDWKAAAEIYNGNPNVYLLKKSFSTEELMSLIGNMDQLIGIRLHALIFAALMHVPFIGISYDPKIDNFLQSVNEKAIFTLENFDSDELFTKSAALLHTDKEDLDWSAVDRLREKARETADILKQVAGARGVEK